MSSSENAGAALWFDDWRADLARLKVEILDPRINEWGR